jgi:hypothetical protein
LGFCSFGFQLVVPLGFVAFGLLVFGFVVPGVPVLGLAGAVPVGGFTAPVGGAVGVRDWPADPGAALPDAEPAVPAPPGAAPPPGAACATIQVAHSKTTESKVMFFIDMMESLQDQSAISMREADSPIAPVSLQNKGESIRRMP